MKKFILPLILFFTLVQFSYAGENIVITDGWIREAPPGSSVTAAYMSIKNISDQSDKLISMSSDIAESVEIHTTKVDENGVASMEMIQILDLPAGEDIKLKPGGMHIMLIGLKESLVGKESINLNIDFEKSGEMIIELPVSSIKKSSDEYHNH